MFIGSIETTTNHFQDFLSQKNPYPGQKTKWPYLGQNRYIFEFAKSSPLLSLLGKNVPQPNQSCHSQVSHVVTKRKDSRSVFALKLWGKIFTIFCTWPPKIGKISVYRRRWQNLILFCLFWEITHHSQTGNTRAKFHISLQRGRIAGQFLHWNFEKKYSQFFALDRQKLAKLARIGTADKIQSFFVTFGKLRTTAKPIIPGPSFTYHYKEVG